MSYTAVKTKRANLQSRSYVVHVQAVRHVFRPKHTRSLSDMRILVKIQHLSA